MITLGVDPGIARLGYGVVETVDDPVFVTCGVFETSAGEPMERRLATLFDHVSALIERERPHVLAMEQLFFARNVTTAIAVGQARGVVMLAAARAGIEVAEYTPSEVKHAVVGYGKADKTQMGEMVRIVLGLDSVPRPDDAADAVAIALCHSQRAAFAERTRT